MIERQPSPLATFRRNLADTLRASVRTPVFRLWATSTSLMALAYVSLALTRHGDGWAWIFGICAMAGWGLLMAAVVVHYMDTREE